MRPEKLTPLFTNISSLTGIGPKLNELFKKLLNNSQIINLLWHLPNDNLLRKKVKDLNNVKIGTNIIIKVKILKYVIPKFYKQPFYVNCINNSIPINILFFNAKHPYIKNNLPIGSEKLISGKLEYYKNTYQITHPENILDIEKIDEIKTIQPLYSLTKGLTQKIYYKTLIKALEKIPNVEEWIDQKTIKKYNFQSWKESIINIHKPSNSKKLINNDMYRKRLAYDELLAHQLSLKIIRHNNQKVSGLQFEDKKILEEKFYEDLPFKLTNSQKNSIKEIKSDLFSKHQMIRLLQGDVGSGKTIISIVSMIIAFESGYQSALMVPTEILGNQHYETMIKFLENLKINIIFLSGKDSGKNREDKILKILNHEVDIIIGTHALIQEDVNFKKLGLVIIDEQHRFGVHQRLAFTYKGLRPNLLVMTATPIPRTLTLAIYGDMDESKLIEKPIGRIDIKTFSTSLSKIDKLIEGIMRIVDKNKKIYWVCPLIEESEEIDLEAATVRFEKLSKIFKDKVLLIHGRLKSKDKESIMNKFKMGSYNILVATTVIEVGIDIPEATNIVIEHAERFGLAQLHQLRGRVGRNNDQSNCILLHKDNIGVIAKKRIDIMKETNDGFKIAEKDLEIRGPGEILGRRQSGFSNFYIADLSFDNDIFEDIRDDFSEMLYEETKIDNNLKNLLYIFEKDIAIKTLKSG